MKGYDDGYARFQGKVDGWEDGCDASKTHGNGWNNVYHVGQTKERPSLQQKVQIKVGETVGSARLAGWAPVLTKALYMLIANQARYQTKGEGAGHNQNSYVPDVIVRVNSLSHSLPHSLTHSLTHRSLPLSLTHSPTFSLTH